MDLIGSWAEASSHHAIFSLTGVHHAATIELIGRYVIRQVRDRGEPSPIP